MHLTNNGEQHILDVYLGGGAKDSTIYIGLISAVADAEAGSVTEITGAGYSRVAVTNDGSVFEAGNQPINNSAAKVVFPEATSNYPADVTHFGIWSAASGGNLRAVVALTSTRTITQGITPEFAIGALTFNAD